MPVITPCWPGSGKPVDLLADVPRLRRRESLALVMQDGLANAEAVRPACRDGA